MIQTLRRSEIEAVIGLLYAERQESLFESSKQEPRRVLEEISVLIEEGKPLYNRWMQRDKNGKERQLSVPKKPLKIFFESYLLSLIKSKRAHESCHGGEAGWSARRSLETHLPCNSILSFDFQSAFQNVPFNLVYDFFHCLVDEDEITRFFAMISTVPYNGRRGLPQGSPHSMALFNRILYQLDEELSQKAGERDLSYSRWVDDLTLTSQEYRGEESFLGAVELASRIFPISEGKIFFQNGDRAYLLGHKIDNNRVSKNTKEEKQRNKNPPLNFGDWFGENKTRAYEHW